jgi:Ulp1 family protease
VCPADVDLITVNDTIIELGLRYLLEGIKKRNPDLHEQIYVFSSFFYKRISEGRRDRKAAYEFVKKWTKKLDIFKKKYLVVPINEKMHWYLAVVTNPYYAVREVERRKGLYESDQEEDEEKDIGSKGKRVDGDEAVEGSDKVVKEGVSAADVEEGVEQPSERKDTLGDTPMEEAKKTTIEVVIPQSSGESDKSARDKMSEQMDLDEKEKPIFEMVHSPELQERSLEHRTQTTPVVDKRSTKGPFALAHAIDVDKDDDVQVLTQTLSPRKAKQSPYRPGVSDGFRNKGKGPLVGGGGPSGTPIEAGQIASFRKDEEEASAAAMKKRKAEDEDGDAHMESPPFRSRSGASYGAMSKVYSRASSTETTQEKHQHWLKRKAVVCVFDSLGSTHKAVRTALREYLCLEYNDKKGGQIEVDEVELEHIDVVSPMQGNFCDCGLYLLHAFERFFHDPTHVMDEVIVSRDRTDPYWQAEDAAQKRQWWRECIQHLIEEYKSEQDLRKAEKEARKRGGGKEKSETTSPSDSRSRTATSEGSQVDMASIESSLEEPTVSKAT